MRNPITNVLLGGTLLCFSSTPGATAQVPKQDGDKPERISVLDLIPADACGVFAVRNLKELKQRGDILIERTGAKHTARPSQLLPMVWGWLGLTRGIDEDGPAAIMVMRHEKPETHVALVLSFDDRDAIAANFDLKGSQLVDGEIVSRAKTEDAGNLQKSIKNFVAVRGKQIICGPTEKAVKMVLESKTVKSHLTKEQRRAFEESDIIGHVSAEGWGSGWLEVVREVKKFLLGVVGTENPQVAAAIGQAFERLRIGLLGVRFDDGVGIHLLTLFGEDELVRNVLTNLAGKSGGARFDALPTEQLVSTYGVSGSGALRVEMMRGALITTIRQIGPTRQYVSAAKLPDIVNVIGEVAHRTRGRRVGIYHNGPDDAQGMLSVVSVLDTDDPAKFRKDMQELAKYVSYAALKPEDDRRPKIAEKTIDELINRLGAVDFRERNSAMTKLLLIGDAALPKLQKAAESSDLEVAFRAKRLRTRIHAKVEERRKGLLDQDLVGRLNPRFGYHVAAEKRDGRAVDIIRVELDKAQGDFEDSMKRFLGPEWKNVRIATIGKSAVVLLGSNKKVFDQTLANLEKGSRALASHSTLKTIQARDDSLGQFKIHFSVERLLALVLPEKAAEFLPEDGENEMTSVTLRIAPTSVRVDAFTPFREIAVGLKSQGLSNR